MPSNHLFFCHPLLPLPSILPSIRLFSNESALCIGWPTYRSFSFSYQSSQWIFRVNFLYVYINFIAYSFWDSPEDYIALFLYPFPSWVYWGSDNLTHLPAVTFQEWNWARTSHLTPSPLFFLHKRMGKRFCTIDLQLKKSRQEFGEAVQISNQEVIALHFFFFLINPKKATVCILNIQLSVFCLPSLFN